MSLNDILEIEKSRLNRERAIYITIYDRMKNRLNNSVKIGSKFSEYTVPEFIFGYPLINVEKAMIYLCHKLTKEGFIYIPLSKNTLLITWDPKHLKELDRRVRNEERKSITHSDKILERDDDDFIQKLISSKISSN